MLIALGRGILLKADDKDKTVSRFCYGEQRAGGQALVVLGLYSFFYR